MVKSSSSLRKDLAQAKSSGSLASELHCRWPASKPGAVAKVKLSGPAATGIVGSSPGGAEKCDEGVVVTGTTVLDG